MRTVVVSCVVFLLCGQCLANYGGSTYYCTDLNSQRLVDIGQLEGIWYVMEKIIHTEQRHYVTNISTCPVIHISEDRTHSTTYNPLFKTYETTYGSGYPYATNEPPYSNEQLDYNKRMEEYDRRTTYDYTRRKQTHLGYIKHLYSVKYLRLYWDDSSYTEEYHLRYNVSRPGYWISSGPEGGITVPDQKKHFAGLVQVLEAVGSHLVLTFCHSITGKNKLFTVILSRETSLDSRDIQSVHGLIVRRGLTTNAVEKSCNKAPTIELNLALCLFILGYYFIHYFVK